MVVFVLQHLPQTLTAFAVDVSLASLVKLPLRLVQQIHAMAVSVCRTKTTVTGFFVSVCPAHLESFVKEVLMLALIMTVGTMLCVFQLILVVVYIPASVWGASLDNFVKQQSQTHVAVFHVKMEVLVLGYKTPAQLFSAIVHQDLQEIDVKQEFQ